MLQGVYGDNIVRCGLSYRHLENENARVSTPLSGREMHVIAGHGSPIATKGPALIAALVTVGSVRKAAALVGIHADTAQRWLADPDFQAELTIAKRQCLDEAQTALRGELLASIELLARLRNDVSKPDHLRRQCAVDLLSLSKGALEGVDVAERLAKMEVALELARHELQF
jgi:hypothetical protein